MLSLVRLLNSLLVALGVALLLAGCKKPSATAAVDPNGPVEVVIPEHGVYTGAFMDFGDVEDDVTLETIEDFEQMVGKHQAIIASSSYWGEQNFPVDNLNVIWRHGSLPLVFWSPWDRPYQEDHGPDKFSLTEILAGKWDAYIDKWADGARSFGHPMIVVFGVEMNGTWFPWSGAYYGGAQWDKDQNNWKGPGDVPQSISPCRGSRPGARRFKYQMDVSYEQLSLSVRNLELRACILSRVGLRRLAWPERLWTAI